MLNKKAFIGAALGTMVEYYDYALFTVFLPIFATDFFPGQSQYDALMKGYLFLLVTALVRPFGGLLFGSIGDLIGRRTALLASMYGIAFSTFLIGLTPGYHLIGTWSAVLIIAAKSLQVFCFGGEFNSAGIYVVEHAEEGQEGLVGGALTAITLLGGFLASLMGIVLTIKGMPAWSWRIAFILGGFLGIAGILYRKNMIETPVFHAADTQKDSLKKLLTQHPKSILTGMFIAGFVIAPYVTLLGFINPVLMINHFFTAHEMMLLQAGLMAIGMCANVSFGYLADRFTPMRVMSLGALFFILSSWFLLHLIDQQQLGLLLFAEICFILMNKAVLAPLHAFMKKTFPLAFRCRGSSLGFCIGVAFIGGITPLVDSYLYKMTGGFSGLALWFVLIGLATLVMLKISKSS